MFFFLSVNFIIFALLTVLLGTYKLFFSSLAIVFAIASAKGSSDFESLSLSFFCWFALLIFGELIWPQGERDYDKLKPIFIFILTVLGADTLTDLSALIWS